MTRKLMLFAVSMVILTAAPAAAQPDIYYFHDSNNDGVWNDMWHTGSNACPWEPRDEYMDCNPPTSPTCSAWSLEFSDRPGFIACHIDLPGCMTGTMPSGNWVVRVWLRRGQFDSYAIRAVIRNENCNVLCEGVSWAYSNDLFDYQLTSQCELVQIVIPDVPELTFENERLMVEIATNPPDAVICWDGENCPSHIQAPDQKFCQQAMEGACCFVDGACRLVNGYNECMSLGGWTYLGDGTYCSPNPCPQPGACCFPGGACQLLPQELCDANGGEWYGATVDCDPNPCPPPAYVCCFPDGTCQMMTEEDCINSGGESRPDLGDTCNPNPCPPTDDPCVHCGPGNHWVDACPAGQDIIPGNSGLVGIDLDLDCIEDLSLTMPPCPAPENVLVINRSGSLDDSNYFPGLRPVDGHLDVIDTEIVELCLQGGGMILRAGSGQGQGGVLAASLGAIAERADDPSLGESFFDVYFEIDLGGGVYVYNHEPLVLEAIIDCVPPQIGYIHLAECLPLYDDPVGGVKLANLIRAQHVVYPVPEAVCCFADGECMLTDMDTCFRELYGEYHPEWPSCDPNPCRQPGEDPCEDCGPGNHWVDTCPADQDVIPASAALVGIDLDLDCIEDMSMAMPPCPAPENVLVIDRTDPLDDSMNFPGTRPVDGHMDVIDTEIIALCLQGGGMVLRAGAGQGQGGVLPPSLGAIAEAPADPALARSFFDVYFEIDLGGGTYAYNHDPLIIMAFIDCVPPQVGYIHLEDCLPLYDQPTGGNIMAHLTRAQHVVYPPPEAVCCFADGECVLTDMETCFMQFHGFYHPEWLSCDPNPCPLPTYVCCFPDGVCRVMNAFNCADAGGESRPDLGDVCDPNPCPQPGEDPCEDCGPGNHWVDTCPADQDVIPASAALVGIDLDLDCIEDMSMAMPPCPAPENVLVIDRTDPLDDSMNFPGTRPVDGHLDVIDTEIIALCLQGGGMVLRAGAGQGQGGVLAASLGAIAEKRDDPSLGESFFDVYFEIDLGGGSYVYNQEPLRIDAIIDCVPPQVGYIHLEGCLPLYDQPNGGNIRANLTRAQHVTYPPPEAACCFADGECALTDMETCFMQFHGFYHPEWLSCDPNPCPQPGEDPCEDCGPGNHWIEQCPGGQDIVAANTGLVGIDTDFDCIEDVSLTMPPCPAPENMLVINRTDPLDDSMNFPGTRPVDGHLDVIDTEIIALCLRGGGMTLRAGAGHGQGGVLAASLGAIAEKRDDPSLGESFFDVYFEIDMGDGRYIYNHDPLILEAIIDCVPPQVGYIHLEGCLPLYDQPIGGNLVANLIRAQHVVYPLPEAVCCFADGECVVTDMESCFMQFRGNYHPEWMSCDPNPCQLADIDWPAEIDRVTRLMPSEPNPFHETTSIRFILAEDDHARVSIWDVAGRHVRTLADGAYAATRHALTWDGRDEAGKDVPAGVYFVRLEAAGRQQSMPLIRLR